MTHLARLERLLAPRAIAVVGASEQAGSWTTEIEASLRHAGYQGDLIPVNPKYREVWGRPCLSAPADLPRGVDLAVVVVPARLVPGLVDELGAAGVGGVMVVSSGFAETGAEGRALQDAVAAAARRRRLPLLGPNIEGFVNYVDRVAPYGTTPPPRLEPGSISVISQSGSVGWTLAHMAADRGLGLRLLVGVGNEAVLGLGDLYAWAARDDATSTVVTYFETVRDHPGMARGLAALRDAGKPVLVCAPAGASEAARRAILAHTGALAGHTGARDAWLRGLGAVVVRDPVQLFEAMVLLDGGQLPRGDGVAAALQSGGSCTLFAEAAAAAGVPLAELCPDTVAALDAVLPPYAGRNNPLDVTGQAAVDIDIFTGVLDALAADPGVGSVVFDAYPPRGESGSFIWAEPVARHAAALARRHGVLIASMTMSPLVYDDAALAFVRRAGIPFVQGHRSTCGALRVLADLQAGRERAPAAQPPHPARAAALRTLRGCRGPLDEVRAARLLSLYGVPRPHERLVCSVTGAVRAARRVGYPVAVKVVAAELPHKARLGGVRLGLQTPAAVRRAATEVLQAARSAGAAAPGLLVQRMADGVEVLVGAVVDERFGPAVTLRTGGAGAEVGDAVFEPAPLTCERAAALARERAAACGLDPARHDLDALAAVLHAVAWAAADLRGRLVSLEANPLLVGVDGAVAVDALAEVRPATTGRRTGRSRAAPA